MPSDPLGKAPGANNPFSCSMALMVACMAKKPTAPEMAATCFSLVAIPIATPMANSIGRLEKTTLPALFITVSNA
ncbi:hypothetical protein D3C81_1696670 [compost metagenome]